MSYKFSKNELRLLNTNLSLKLMLQQENLEPAKVLRYVKYEHQIEQLQVELIKLQQWVISKNKRICLLFEVQR